MKTTTTTTTTDAGKPARPRPWHTSDKNADGTDSFARDTVAVRIPKILEDTRAAVLTAGTTPEVDRALQALVEEVRAGRLRALVDDDGAAPAANLEHWARAAAAHVGKSWLELPWYFAEAFVWRRVLEATGWFRARAASDAVDPWRVTKLDDEAGFTARLAQVTPGVTSAKTEEQRVRALVALSLWGNRADLSYTAGRAHGDVGGDDDLLIDERARAAQALLDAKRVAFVLDNAGTELGFDLLLASALRSQARREVALLCKAHPFFVSDATADDVARMTARMGLQPFAGVRAHPYWTSSGFLFADEMPAELADELRSYDVVVVKGDANYRRLVGDAPWPHATPLADAMSFPARTTVVLRTCKAEVQLGVPADVEERARARDPRWMVSGRFGMVAVV